MHVALLERRIGVALFGGHEAGAHLHPLGPQLQNVVDVLARVNAAAGDDRDMAVVRRLEGVHLLHDRGQDLFERVVLVLDLIGLVAEVAAGLRPFDDDRVGNVAVVGQPLFAQEFRADETIGASFVRQPSVRNDGRFNGSPAPEKMMSAFS